MSFVAPTSCSVAHHDRRASVACAFGTLAGGVVPCAAVTMTITTMTNAAP